MINGVGGQPMALMRLSSEGRWDNALFEPHPGWEKLPSRARSHMLSLRLSPSSVGLLTPFAVVCRGPALLRCYISRYPFLCNFLPLPLALIHSNNTPFPASQPISPPFPSDPLPISISLPPVVSFQRTKPLCDVQPWQVAPDLLS